MRAIYIKKQVSKLLIDVILTNVHFKWSSAFVEKFLSIVFASIVERGGEVGMLVAALVLSIKQKLSPATVWSMPYASMEKIVFPSPTNYTLRLISRPKSQHCLSSM